MFSIQRFFSIPCLLALGVSACSSSGAKENPSSFLPPLGLVDHAVFIDQGNDRAFLLDLSGNLTPHANQVRLPKAPILAQRRLSLAPAEDPDEVLILSAGDLDATESVPSITVLNKQGVKWSYKLAAAFDSMVQSPNGRYLVVKFSQTNVSNRLLFNRNEVAIIDLTQEPNELTNPVDRTIRGFGEPPESIVFSPPLMINGEERQLAVVLFKQVVALLDLKYLNRPEFTIELAASSVGAPSINLEQVLFDDKENKVYLRGSASPDIYVIQIAPRDVPNEPNKNDFVPSLNQLGGGGQLKDMALYGDAPERRLLVAAGANALVINADSNRVTSIPLPVSATKILLFEGRSPQVDTRETRALLYSLGTSDVVFLDLAQIEDRKQRNAERLKINSYLDVIPLRPTAGDASAPNQVMLRHAGLLGASIVDLDKRTVNAVSSQVDLKAGTPDAALNGVWVAPSYQNKVGFIDLSDPNKIQPKEVRLDYPVVDLLLFTQAAHKRVLVTHDSSLGRATVLEAMEATDLRDLTRAVTLEGFLLGE